MSRDEWARTEPTALDSGLISRIASDNANHVLIAANITDENAKLYIKEIAFFSSAEEAYAYYPTVIKTDKAENMTRYFRVYDSPSGISGDLFEDHSFVENVGKYDFITVNNDGVSENVLSLMESSKFDVGDYYRVLFFEKSDINQIGDNQKYMTVKYRTNYEDAATLAFSDYNCQLTQIIDSNISKSAGEWVFSEPALIGEDLHNRTIGYRYRG